MASRNYSTGAEAVLPKIAIAASITAGMWWGLAIWSAYATVEYTIPIMPQLRGALFYDVGTVSAAEGSFSGDVNSNVGVGLRIYLPVGPLRLDYGIPLSSDEFNDSSGRFNFNIGYRF